MGGGSGSHENRWLKSPEVRQGEGKSFRVWARYTYCLGPASIRSPQIPEKVSYIRSEETMLIDPRALHAQRWVLWER